jgi:putative Holliday junction resolvase
VPRLLAVDLGSKRIGLALSDELGFLASSHSVLPSRGRQQDARAVAQIAKSNDASTIVLGLPLSLSGEEGPQAEKTRRFADALAKQGVEVQLWDERLTTLEAQRYLRDAGMRRAKRAATIDAAAAAVLLQSYLDAKRARG